MGISKIGSLFASNIDPLVRQSALAKRDPSPQAQSQRPRGESEKSKVSTEAVVYTPSATTQVSASARQQGSAETSRSARVRDLKERVDSGVYGVDSEKVAVAILKELA